MSVQNSRAAIAKAVQDLLVRWVQTRGEWDDVVAETFEKEFLEPIQQDVKPAGTAMDTMEGLIAQMRRDCSE
jgi:hypothetical protein